MIYKDEEEVVHTVKGTMNGIRRSLKEGLLGDAGNVRISRSKGGPFEALKNHPEFRDLVIEPATMPGVTKRTAEATPCAANPHQATLPTLPVEPTTSDPSSLSLPQLPSNPNVNAPQPPTIHLQHAYHQPVWVKWLIFFFFALATGLAGYVLVPMLMHLRLW